jgi:hypothetical protein
MHGQRLWMAGLGAVSLVACFEVEYPFRYISLEAVPGIEIERTARIAQKQLRGGAVVATEYRLVRQHYTLHFSIVQESLHPAVKVAVEGSRHSLQFYRDVDARAPNGAICASFYPATKSAFDFGWEPECTDPTLPMAIDFDVRNESGTVVARESIVFSLKKNGTYRDVDTL